jgi:hypothetical protein
VSADRRAGLGCYDERVLKAALTALVLVLTFGSAVSAQNDSVVGVGGGVSFYAATDPNVETRSGLGLVGRLRRGTGLGFSLGLEWFTSDVRTDVDGEVVPLGTVTVRPVMVGASYSRQFARFALTAGIVGGWSFNSVSQTPAQQKTYGDAIGMPDAHLSVSNCWVTRPSVTVWYELDNHFGAFASMGYAMVRPTVTAHGAAGQRGEAVNLSGGVVSFGLAYGVF